VRACVRACVHIECVCVCTRVQCVYVVCVCVVCVDALLSAYCHKTGMLKEH